MCRPVAGGGDMDSDGKLEPILRDEHCWDELVCECWFAVIVIESVAVGPWPWYDQTEEAGVIGPVTTSSKYLVQVRPPTQLKVSSNV